MRKSTDEKRGASAAILATRPHMAQARAIQPPIAARGFRRVPLGRSLAAMNDREKRAEKVRQQRRLGAALRENLKRRKAQAKARAGSAGAAGAAKSHDSAGIAGHKQER
jgi:hypothetical protein